MAGVVKWKKRLILVGGLYYRRLPLSRTALGESYYELLTNKPWAMCYSYLIVRYHYPMLQYK